MDIKDGLKTELFQTLTIQSDVLPSYPKILRLDHPSLGDIFKGSVNVEEKIDGSNFGWSVDSSGKPLYRSRRKQLYENSPDKMFNAAINAVNEIIKKYDVAPNVIFWCEYLSKPKHNCLCYGRVPENNLIVYDIQIKDMFISDYKEKQGTAAALGLETVPLLFNGEIKSLASLKKLLETESILGNQKVEGVVIKNYAYKTVGMDGIPGYLMAKLVREEFKELNAKTFQSKDVVSKIVGLLRTHARWEKAVAGLKESGELVGEPKDIGPLVQMVQNDIASEEEFFISQMLIKHYMPQVKRGSTAGLAEWYKDRLLVESEGNLSQEYELNKKEI